MFQIMHEQKLVAGDIDAIVVRVPTIEHGLLSGSPTLNINLEYIMAVAALDGQVTWEQYSEERQNDPIVRDLWHRVRTEGDPELDRLFSADPGSGPAEVLLSTRDGRRFTGRMDFPPGHFRNPLSSDELREKFMYWSTRVISEGQALKLHAVVENLDQLADINDLGDLLRL